MTDTIKHEPNPDLDLVLERVIDVPVAAVWKAWTDPEMAKQWFTPAPWKTADVKIDLRPGGAFALTMESPEGEQFPTVGCYLEIVENQKLVWTSALGPGYRPNLVPGGGTADSLFFTAIITLEDLGGKTKYTALAVHGDKESRDKHAAMGFQEGWGMALDQLVALVSK